MVNRQKEARNNDAESKSKGREYADKKRQAKSSNIQVGDVVILKQKRRNKFTTKFESTPYTVIECKGTKIVAENKKHRVTRNASFFKKVKEGEREEDDQYHNAKMIKSMYPK